MSTHPMLNILPSWISMKIGILSNYELKMMFFLFLLKFNKRVKSYGLVNFRVKVKPCFVWKVISQKLFHIETSSWAQFLDIWNSFPNMYWLCSLTLVLPCWEIVEVFDLDLGRLDLHIKKFKNCQSKAGCSIYQP